jgi:hypothetical protein
LDKKLNSPPTTTSNNTMALPKATTKTAPDAAVTAAAAFKKTAGPKATGKTDVEYSMTTPAIRVVLKKYSLSTPNKYAVSYFAEGSTNFYKIKFFVNIMLPKVGGYLATLLDEGFTINWSHPIEERLFTMGTLRSIIGEDNSSSHVRVRMFNKVTQTMNKNKIKPDANGLYWGDPQKVHLKSKCTGTPITQAKVYQAPPTVDVIRDKKGHQNYQFLTIVSCKVQIADLQKTADNKTFQAARAPPPALVLGTAGRGSMTGGAASKSSSSPRGVGLG